MEFNEITVLKVFAIGLDDDIPDHRIEYLLKKLFGLDSLVLDQENYKLFQRMDKIAQKLSSLL